jgi:RNA polymerase sigma-70 factor (ECF subfamily)
MPADIADLLLSLLPRLRRYALVLTRSAEQADDLVQAACERALAAGRGPGDGVPFDAWMMRIARNQWIDQRRRARHEGPAGSADDDATAAAAGAAPDTADVADQRRALHRVRAAIDQLPDDQREVLLLVCGEGRSYRDAADALGVPIGTVMSRLARARTRLAALAGLGSGSPAGIAPAPPRLREDLDA